jgi:hypothetical protein
MRDSHLYIIIAVLLLVLLSMSRSEGFYGYGTDIVSNVPAFFGQGSTYQQVTQYIPQQNRAPQNSITRL